MPRRTLMVLLLLLLLLAAGRGTGLAQQAPSPAAAPTAVLTWTDYGTGVGYDGVSIQRKTANGPYAEIGRVAKGVTTFTDITLTLGQQYCWVVVGVMGSLQAPASNEACGAVLSAITNLVLKFQ